MAEEEQERKTGLLPVQECPAWRSRGLTADSCRKWRLGITDFSGKRVRVFEYRNSKSTPVAQKVRPRSKKDMRFLGEPSEAGLYGQHLWGTGGKMVVVTEGEIDAVSISQVQGHKWPVVSVPNGAQGARKALQKNLEWLSTFETVVLWFDDDDAGREAAEECAPLFKPGSCRIARCTPFKDANEALVAGQPKAIITAIWQAKVWRPDGIVSGDDLWEAISRPKKVPSIPYPWEGLQEKNAWPPSWGSGHSHSRVRDRQICGCTRGRSPSSGSRGDSWDDDVRGDCPEDGPRSHVDFPE
jgi:twinkle protein